MTSSSNGGRGVLTVIVYCALAGTVMGYGWGYRGTVGHEAGAMVPGALLGLAVCVGSGRLDWQRRAAVAGLFGAVGWAWGGSLSYMEQTFYILSDSLSDVLYGYAVIFLLGALWAGCGGAILGIGLTEPRSELARLARPFATVCAAFFAVYLYFLLFPEHREAYETFTVRHFHDGDWLSATITLVISAVYWWLRQRDRSAAAVLFWAAVAWWIGYGLLTKLGGVRLAPLHRSESWGGVLGVLVVLLTYLWLRRNRAAFTMGLYGVVVGGLAFVLAVFVHHPLVLRWGPFADVGLPLPPWRTAEVSFGFLMGGGMAYGASRLLRGGLAPPKEDEGRAPLDAFAVFVLLVALTWINFRRHIARALPETTASDSTRLFGLQTESWYFILGVLVTVPFLFGLYRYWRGDRSLVPQSAFGKGAAVLLLLIWVTLAGQLLDIHPTRAMLIGNLCLWLPAAVGTCLVFFVNHRESPALEPRRARLVSDVYWRVGRGYVLTWAAVPVVLAGVTASSLAMQDGAFGDRARLRFGPDAYWRQTAQLVGRWRVVGLASEFDATPMRSDTELPQSVEFDLYRNVAFHWPDGTPSDEHRWFLKNQYIWLGWFAKAGGHPDRTETPLHFAGGSLRISWPPNSGSEGYLVLEREVR